MEHDECLSKLDSIQEANRKFLELFLDDLAKAGLTRKTIDRHFSNADFYINEYLLRVNDMPMESGVTMLDDFLGNFFIRKCMWSTPDNIKTTAASIKKFYKCMLDHKLILKTDYDSLCYEIKNSMEIWQEDCAIYNDPNLPNPFFLF